MTLHIIQKGKCSRRQSRCVFLFPYVSKQNAQTNIGVLYLYAELTNSSTTFNLNLEMNQDPKRFCSSLKLAEN